MKTIENNLKKEKKELEAIAKATKQRLKSAPQGHLRIADRGRSAEYYYKSEEDSGSSNGRYLKRSEMDLVRRISQRDYYIHILKNVEDRIRAIDIFLDKYEKTNLSRVYQKTNIYRRKMICPFVIPDDEYVRLWQKFEYKKKHFNSDTPEIITERGERVRSKSEKIIADKLNLLGIPYRYECPLILEGNIEMYPDFTILNVLTREEVYLEHFGLMDDINYVENMMFKLNTYERNGIYLGVNLFITHETSKIPLNTRTLDGLIRKLFCTEQ